MNTERWYILVGDNDGHDYVIPSNKLREWWLFLEDEEAYSYGPLPRWAERVEGIEFQVWRAR